MDLRDTPDEAAFRSEARAWIEANFPSELTGPRSGEAAYEQAWHDWSRKLADAGYAGLTWPKEYGGSGAPYSHQAILQEELARAEAPQHMGVIGLGMAGPTIMAWGTPEQKERYLSKILSAEEIWCQGFSEPDAGSDLAASRTRIEDRGDHFLVNGQKVWSSFAHVADFCILVGLGDPEAPRYKNLTYLITWLGMKEVGALEPKPGLPPSTAHLMGLLEQLKQTPAKAVVRAAYNDPRPAEWMAERAKIPSVMVPFTVGGTDAAKDLFALYEDTLVRLLAVTK